MSELSRSVAGRVVVVTGASSGMGRAIAMLFGAEGARVAALDRDADGVAKVDDVVAKLGPVGILVNNAGVSLPAPIEAAEYEDAWDATLAVNLTGYVRMIRACRPHLLDAGAGRIVNIASTEGLGATPFLSPY